MGMGSPKFPLGCTKLRSLLKAPSAGLYAHDVEPGVDMKHFACDSAGEVREEIEGCPCDVLLGDVPSKGRLCFDYVEYVLEAADTCRGKCLYGPGRDRVDPYSLWAEVSGKIEGAGLERGLGHAHDMVVVDYLFASIIAHGYHRALPACHQRGGGPGKGYEGERAYVHRELEALPGGRDELSF